MSLLQMIKDDQLTARKKKETLAAQLLTTLIGEASIIGKNDGNRETSDEEVIAVIKKFIKNIDETIPNLPIEDDRISNIIVEKDILNLYLPDQLTGDVLTGIVSNVIGLVGAASPKDMGKVMKMLKDTYDGEYDGKEASTIVKELLK